MKFKSYLLILIFLFSSFRAFALPRCENFYNTIYNESDRFDVYLDSDVDIKTIGIRLDKYWNPNKLWSNKEGKEYKIPGWSLNTNKEGYFIVSKITKSSLKDRIKVGDIVLSINDIDLREINKDKDKNNILRRNVSNLFEAGELIKFKLLRNEEIIEIDRTYLKATKPNIENTLETFDRPLIDFYINSIEVNEKEGSFNASIETSFLSNTDERFYITEVMWDQLVTHKKFEDKNLINFRWEQCNFSEERWKKINSNNPAYGLKFGNLIREDRQVRNSEYLIKPKFSLLDKLETGGYLQNKGNIIFKSTSFYEIKNEFNLKTFPFDRQKVKIFLYNELHDLNMFRASISHNTAKRALQFMDQNSIQGWNIKNYNLKYEFNDDPNSFRSHDGVSLEFDIERKSRYYVIKIILPIILILTVCWSAVWIDPKEIESRLTITIVCLLSLIAYNFVIDSELPKLEYLTIMDYIILISYIYATIPNFLSIISFNLIKKDKLLAEKYELYEKKFGLPSYLLIVLLIIIISTSQNSDHAASTLAWLT